MPSSFTYYAKGRFLLNVGLAVVKNLDIVPLSWYNYFVNSTITK